MTKQLTLMRFFEGFCDDSMRCTPYYFVFFILFFFSQFLLGTSGGALY